MNDKENFLKVFEEMRCGINEKILGNVTKYIEIDEFLNEGYDEVIDELAKNCEKFHKKYPHDLLFKFGSSALRFYNEKFRGIHLGFVKKTFYAYFEKNLVAPKRFINNPINFCAIELEKLLKSLSCEVKKISVEKSKAIVEVKIYGDNSSYGKMWGNLEFKFELKKVEGKWKINKILNVRELVPEILEMAETYWPREWDLGIKL